MHLTAVYLAKKFVKVSKFHEQNIFLLLTIISIVIEYIQTFISNFDVTLDMILVLHIGIIFHL